MCVGLGLAVDICLLTLAAQVRCGPMWSDAVISHTPFMDALLQIASVFCTEIAVEKHFDLPKCDFWRGLKKFSRLAIARHILGPPHELCCNSTTGCIILAH